MHNRKFDCQELDCQTRNTQVNMNDFFSNLFQNAAQYPGSAENRARSAPRPGPNAQRHPAQGHVSVDQSYQTQGCTPAASQRSIGQLPTVVVTAEDLVDENNRSCCICFEDHSIGSKVSRLPCAHIYHTSCITAWLHKNCTCPVCRYELPTDDSDYEHGRIERMAQRKPRFAKYELQRLSARELKDLCYRLNIKMAPMEKNEIIDAVIQSGKIDIISSPNPIEYESIAVLRAMSISQLKKAMTDAGVFFDSKFVIEKEDMVQIYVNSGRLVFQIYNSPAEIDERI